MCCFYTAFARTPLKIKFVNLWAAADGVHRDSLAKSGIFAGISLAHMTTALRNRLDEKRWPRICLSLTPMVSSRFWLM